MCHGGALEGGAPKGGGAKISRFFPSPAPIFALFVSLGCLLVEFWWCLKHRNPQMCTLGVLVLSRRTKIVGSSGLGPRFAMGNFKMSVFYPTRNFRQFWADPSFSAVRSTFLAEEEAQNVELSPHRKFLAIFGPPTPNHLNTKTPEHLNTMSPKHPNTSTEGTDFGQSRFCHHDLANFLANPICHAELFWCGFQLLCSLSVLHCTS